MPLQSEASSQSAADKASTIHDERQHSVKEEGNSGSSPNVITHIPNDVVPVKGLSPQPEEQLEAPVFLGGQPRGRMVPTVSGGGSKPKPKPK